MAEEWTKLKVWPELYLERLNDAGVARIVLNRPEKKNSLNGELFEAFFASLEIIRADRELKIVITKGAGGTYSSGFFLPFLRAHSHEGLADWDRPRTMDRLAEELRFFPRVTIAQIEGYCLGGALALMNSHDLVFAADDAQIGMPEVMRGSFGQFATSTLVHSQIPIKKAAYIQLVGQNLSGADAERIGLASLAMPAAELEAKTVAVARELSLRHLAVLEHAKIAVQMGRDLTLTDAMKLDHLVGQRLAKAVDATGDVDSYLKSQKGGPNLAYKRPDA
ncbi:MAG TPA: enoyl-CoA hydratase/isomerase family protein [Stellaceae bacterium]|jgi:enoyl-CoA hydratase/carnithine racemase|nr:enoyl-CoA hydratase/isomerase family protein [Stellaceae bacterium]